MNNNDHKFRAIVTGSSGRIGNAICKKLSHYGFKVMGMDKRNQEGPSNLDSFLLVDLGSYVSNEDYAKNVLDAVEEWLADEKLTLLVNNAAIQIIENFENLERSSWSETLKINLEAPLFLSRDLIPHFEEGKGSIINISSVHARQTKAGFLSYSISKAGLSAATKSLAIELGKRIRVNAIEPAAILTPMLESGMSKESLERLKLFHPQERIGTPEEIASLVLGITVGDFRFLHGACIDVSGGISNRLHDPE